MDDSKSLHKKWLFHQTSIYKWLFGVPGIHHLQNLLSSIFVWFVYRIAPSRVAHNPKHIFRHVLPDQNSEQEQTKLNPHLFTTEKPIESMYGTIYPDEWLI